MKDGKMSMKDLDSTHARRDDARFEERMADGGETAKFQVDDVVYHKKHNTIGIVRIGESRGEVKTDADGNVDVDDLQYYNPLKHEAHKGAKVAPSTFKEVEERSLWQPFSERASQLAKGGQLEVGDMVMVDDSGYVKYFSGFDTNNPAKIISKDKGKSFGKVKYFYGLETADGKKPFNKAIESMLTKVSKDGGMMAKGGITREGNHLMHFEPYFEKNVQVASIDEDSKIIRPSHGYWHPNKIGKKSIAWAKRNGYKFIQDGKEFEYGGMMAQGGVTEKEVVESNAEMVLSKIKEVHHHADELGDIVTNKSDIEAWVVAKIERASTDLSDITHYLDGQHEKMSMGGSINNYVHKMDKK